MGAQPLAEIEHTVDFGAAYCKDVEVHVLGRTLAPARLADMELVSGRFLEELATTSGISITGLAGSSGPS